MNELFTAALPVEGMMTWCWRTEEKRKSFASVFLGNYEQNCLFANGKINRTFCVCESESEREREWERERWGWKQDKRNNMHNWNWDFNLARHGRGAGWWRRGERIESEGLMRRERAWLKEGGLGCSETRPNIKKDDKSCEKGRRETEGWEEEEEHDGMVTYPEFVLAEAESNNIT